MKTMQTCAFGCALAAGALLATGTAFAQPGPGGPGRGPGPDQRPGFAELDTNGDGKISFEEVQAQRPGATRERFDAMDTDGDGVLTPADRPGRGDRPGAPGQGGNAPREYSMTFEQAQERWPNLTRERFDTMDTDGDGVLTRADRAGRDNRRGGRQVAPGEDGGKADDAAPPLDGRRPRDGRGPGYGPTPQDGQGFGPAPRDGRGPGYGTPQRDGQGFGRQGGPGFRHMPNRDGVNCQCPRPPRRPGPPPEGGRGFGPGPGNPDGPPNR